MGHLTSMADSPEEEAVRLVTSARSARLHRHRVAATLSAAKANGADYDFGCTNDELRLGRSLNDGD
jgi:hypothetical protein